ncbi:signal peptidase I [Colwelliaceae bacterium MEBiC 14330]
MSISTKPVINFLKKHKQLVFFLALMSIFRSAIADWYSVPTGSMQPTIKEGDRIIVNKMAYDLRVPFTDISLASLDSPKRGEIIVFESHAANLRLIKRIVGLPGDIISMNNETITVNGQQLSLQAFDDKGVTNDASSLNYFSQTTGKINHRVNIDDNASSIMSNFSPVTVPKGHYLVLGDNRRHSADSRVYGFVPHHELRGKATAIAFSVDYNNFYIPRKERFLLDIYANNL